MTIVTNFVTSGGSGGSTLVTFVTDFETFGGSGSQFGDLCEGFCDLWGGQGGQLW